MNTWLIAIPVAYLMGSIPFGYLLVKAFRHQDIRATGSGNIGTTNVLRSGAKSLAFATLLLDVGKAFLAVLIAERVAPGNFDLATGAAVAVVIGHCYPVWLRFRGGKGVASALGVFLALTWPSALCILCVFIVIVAFTRFVSLASIIAAASLPFFAFYFVTSRTPIAVAGFLFITFLIIAKHHQNMRRLLDGTENRFGADKQGRKAVA